MLIDSHAHLDMYPAADLPQVLARARSAGVGAILAIGTRRRPPPRCTARLRSRRSPTRPICLPSLPAQASIPRRPRRPHLTLSPASPSSPKIHTASPSARSASTTTDRRQSCHRNPEKMRSSPSSALPPPRANPSSSTAGHQGTRHSPSERQIRSRRRLGGPACATHRALAAAWSRRHHALLLRHGRPRPAIARSRSASTSPSPATSPIPPPRVFARPQPLRPPTAFWSRPMRPFLAPIPFRGQLQRARPGRPHRRRARRTARHLARRSRHPHHRQLPHPLSDNQALEAQPPASALYFPHGIRIIALTWSAKSTCRKVKNAIDRGPRKKSTRAST